MSDQTKQRHITLTDRPPVLITESEWPEIASASAHDGEVEAQAIRTWRMKARQHADGRAIVYGVRTSAYPTEPTWRGGELLPAGDGRSIVEAIRRVGEDGDMPDNVIRECVADLPPEEL